MKVFLTFVVIAFATKVNSQQPPQLPIVQFDMNDFMAHQQQHMQHMQPQGRDHQMMHIADHEQGRQMEADEPMVGSPLMGLKMGMPFGVHHALGGGLHGLTGLGGIPGLRFNNFHAGRIGGLKFGNMLLGAENPNADEGDSQLEAKKWKWFKHVENNLGEPQRYQAEPELAAPQQQQGFFPFHLLNPDAQQHYQAEPELAAPQQNEQGIFPFHHHHFLNGDSNLGAAQQQQHIDAQAQQYHLAAQQHQEQQHINDHQQQFVIPQQPFFDDAQVQQQNMQPVGPPMTMHMQGQQASPSDPNMPMVQFAGDNGERHFWKSDKKGYGGYG